MAEFQWERHQCRPPAGRRPILKLILTCFVRQKKTRVHDVKTFAHVIYIHTLPFYFIVVSIICMRLFGAGRGTVRVGSADRTHTKAWFNKETRFGISFGRIPIVLAEFQWESVKVGRRPILRLILTCFVRQKEDTSARRKNLHVFRWYVFAAEKFTV